MSTDMTKAEQARHKLLVEQLKSRARRENDTIQMIDNIFSGYGEYDYIRNHDHHL